MDFILSRFFTSKMSIIYSISLMNDHSKIHHNPKFSQNSFVIRKIMNNIARKKDKGKTKKGKKSKCNCIICFFTRCHLHYFFFHFATCIIRIVSFCNLHSIFATNIVFLANLAIEITLRES